MENAKKTEKTTTSISGVKLTPKESRLLRVLALAEEATVGEFLANCFRTVLESEEYAALVQAMPSAQGKKNLAAAD